MIDRCRAFGMGEVIDREKWDLSKGGRNFVREGDVSPYKGNCFKMSGKETNLLPMYFFTSVDAVYAMPSRSISRI